MSLKDFQIKAVFLNKASKRRVKALVKHFPE